jgi:hypothetical protein
MVVEDAPTLSQVSVQKTTKRVSFVPGLPEALSQLFNAL